MEKKFYFIREKDEDFIPMITNHETPYTNFQNALKDAREMVKEEPDIELEVVMVLIEESWDVTIKGVK